MITKKILKLEDDPSRRTLKGSSHDEERATRLLVRGKRIGIIGPSKNVSNSNPQGNRRTVPAVPVGSTPRPRFQHRQDAIQLAEYFLEGEPDANGERPHKDGKGRVEYATSINCQLPDKKPLSAEEVRRVANWMGETAALNTRARKASTLHYVVSLHEIDADKSTPELWNDTVERMLKSLGMDEHQALLVIHGDTDNPHMHIMVNRVHPTKHTVADPLRDLIALEELNRQLEKDYGLRVDKGRHIDPVTGQTYDWDKVRKGEIHVPKNRARKSRIEMEKFARQVKKDLADKPFSTAISWDQLEERLSKNGYHLKPSGRGMKICDIAENEVKLTKIAGKGNGREKLEERLGPWNDYLASIELENTREMAQEDGQSEKPALPLGTQEKLNKPDPLAEFRPSPIGKPQRLNYRDDKEPSEEEESQIDKGEDNKRDEKKCIYRKQIDKIKGHPWVVGINLPECSEIKNESELRELIAFMTPNERMGTYCATKAQHEKMIAADAPWLELRQIEKTLGRIERSLDGNQLEVINLAPLAVDPENESDKAWARGTLDLKTEKHIGQLLEATWNAHVLAKKNMNNRINPSENAKMSSQHRAAFNLIKAFMHEKGMAIPNMFHPNQTKRSRGRGRGN
ncbi:relaxase/mobilization nuclease domain-containing protein [Magnetovibrio sp.]|uniref:relaxase/mobilization nuclease domain-containing protein n=1 Tax=Magnetovibrio sp. TaxID=2024836 RepID=UPI002F94447F